jgi:GAF domain-containing protein
MTRAEHDAPAEELPRQLGSIARILLAPSTVDETLQRIVDLSAQAITNCDEAGLCRTQLLAGHPTPTSPVAAQLDALQTALEEGPCVDALAGADSVYVHDLDGDGTWREFGVQAVAMGMRSVLAYRLFAGTDTFGALQLYARLPGAFNVTDRAQGLIFAAHAGLALSLAQTQEEERGRSDNLQVALMSREIIGQAQGILMERERITAEQAFDLLRRASQDLNIKLREVAQGLVDTGLVPSGADPSSEAADAPR